MSVEDFIITVYCLIDDELKKLLQEKKLRSRGFEPKLTDAEIITMEVVGEFLGKDTDTGVWRYFSQHWRKLFPELGSRSNFAKHCANLWQLKQSLQVVFLKGIGAQTDILHMSDGFPIPICHFKRAYFSQLFKGEAAYGHCASKGETYYGFKGNLVISSEGIITGMTVTSANIDERESLWEIVRNIKGLVIADKGLVGENFQKEMQDQADINVQTPSKSNMKAQLGKDANSWLISTRRLVETVIAQLSEQFNIEKVRARDLWHLTTRISRKILSHTVGCFVNKLQGNSPLQFEKLGIV